MSNQIGQNDFRPQPGRFGVMPTQYSSGPIGGANFLGGASPLTANATVVFELGPVTAKSVFSRLAASAVTPPVDADGTTLAYLYKYDASADAAVQISGPLDLQALVTREGALVAPLSTLNINDITFEEGDTLEVHVVNDSAAIDTQPVGLVFNVEMLVQQ